MMFLKSAKTKERFAEWSQWLMDGPIPSQKSALCPLQYIAIISEKNEILNKYACLQVCLLTYFWRNLCQTEAVKNKKIPSGSRK